MLVELPPGEHTLELFHDVPMITSLDGVVEEDFSSQENKYPVKRKFRIESGTATNLGKLFYYDANPDSLKLLKKTNINTVGFSIRDEYFYVLAYLDNSVTMKKFMKNNHSQLYDKLEGSKIHLERGNYLSLKDLTVVQNETANYALRQKLKRHQTFGSYVGGKVGSVGVIKYNNGTAKIEKVIETNNVMNFSQCSGDFDRLICMLDRRKFLTVYNDQVTTHEVPAKLEVNSAYITDTATILVDDYFNVYTKLHSDEKWHKNSKFKSQLAIEKNNNYHSGLNDFKFSSGKNGIYIYAYNQNLLDLPVLFNDYLTNSKSIVKFPEKIKNIIEIKDTNKGLYAATSRHAISSSELFYLSSFSESWVKHMIPASSCLDIVFQDTAGDNIEAVCENNQVGLISYNGGETWVERN
jgi:hypothetical protein